MRAPLDTCGVERREGCFAAYQISHGVRKTAVSVSLALNNNEKLVVSCWGLSRAGSSLALISFHVLSCITQHNGSAVIQDFAPQIVAIMSALGSLLNAFFNYRDCLESWFQTLAGFT